MINSLINESNLILIWVFILNKFLLFATLNPWNPVRNIFINQYPKSVPSADNPAFLLHKALKKRNVNLTNLFYEHIKYSHWKLNIPEIYLTMTDHKKGNLTFTTIKDKYLQVIEKYKVNYALPMTQKSHTNLPGMLSRK